MKKMFFIFFLFFSLRGKAQVYSYHPFPTSYAFWVEAEGFYPNFISITYNILNGDSIINGKTYNKFYTSPYDTNYAPYLNGFIREDTTRKVFFQPHGVGLYPDYLIYDFNLSIGDTLKKYCCGLNNDTLFSVVTQIDTIQTLIDSRRRFKIQSSNIADPIWGFQDDNSYIIEGIGSSLGFSGYGNAPFNVPQEAPYFQLLCYWENGEYILQPSYGCFSLAIEEVGKEKFIFSTYPNPATDFLKVISPAFLSKKLLITINNNTGQYLYYHKAFSEIENSININNFITGTYHLNVLDETGRIVYTSEIFKQ